MATRNVYLTGKAKWAKLTESNMDTKFGEKYTIDVYLDDAGIIALKSSGSRITIREDEEGKFVKLSKDHKRKVTDEDTGQLVDEILGPPDVGMGKDEEGYLIPFKELIGNGSTVEVKVAVYDSKFGKGTRLEAVNVLNHVPYESKSPDGKYKF